MKLKDLIAQYGEYEIYPDSPKHIENAFKDLDSKDDGTLCLCVKKSKPKSVWDLEVRDIYYDLHSDGQIHPLRYEGKESDTKRILTGSAFLTKEEAEQDLERRRVEALLLRFGGRRWFKRGSANYFLEFYGESLKADYTNSSNFAWQGLIYNENGVCVFRAYVYDEDENLLATGTAYEKESSSFINKTSYIENCETSAVGRALGMAGFGIDVSVASYEEVANAIENQNPKKQEEPKGDDGFTNLLIEVKQAQTRMDDLGIDFRDDKKVRSWVINKSGVETTDIGQMTEPMLKEVLKAYRALINAKEKSMKA